MTYRKAIFHSVVISQINCRIYIQHIFLKKEEKDSAKYLSSRKRIERKERRFCKKIKDVDRLQPQVSNEGNWVTLNNSQGVGHTSMKNIFLSEYYKQIIHFMNEKNEWKNNIMKTVPLYLNILCLFLMTSGCNNGADNIAWIYRSLWWCTCLFTTKPYTKIVTNNLLKYDREIVWNDVAYYVNNGRSMFRPFAVGRDMMYHIQWRETHWT